MMINSRKTTLALAVTAAVAAGGASLAQAQTLAVNSLGQALIYPYLLAKGNWSSFLHVTNTGSTTVAAKLRFRSAVDSQDVFDIDVVLSPRDMFTGTVEIRDGLVGWRATDNTCTVPHYGVNNFQPFNPQVSEVYAEVIMMGISSGGSIATAAKHAATGLPAGCGTVATAFADPGNAIFTSTGEFSPANATRSGGDLNNFTGTGTAAVNVLTGKFDLVNVALGQSGAGRATVLNNFGAGPGSYVANTNMYPFTASTWALPSLASGDNGLEGVERALYKSNLINEWVLNAGLGEESIWTVTFPTKSLRGLGPNNCYYGAPGVFNREEQPPLTPSYELPLCNEANVIFFQNSAGASSADVLNSAVGVGVTVNNPATNQPAAGWMDLALSGEIIDNGYLVPAVGYNLTARATPADAVLYDHAFLPASSVEPY